MKISDSKLKTSKRINWLIFTVIPATLQYYDKFKSEFKKVDILNTDIFHSISGFPWILLPIGLFIFWYISDKIKARRLHKKLEDDFSVAFHKSWNMRTDIIYGANNVDGFKKLKNDAMINYLLELNYNKEEIQYAFDKYYNDYIKKFITIAES